MDLLLPLRRSFASGNAAASLGLLESLQSALGSSCSAPSRLGLVELIDLCLVRTSICFSTAAASQMKWLRFGRVPFYSTQVTTAFDRLEVGIFYISSLVHMQAGIQTLVREESVWTL